MPLSPKHRLIAAFAGTTALLTAALLVGGLTLVPDSRSDSAISAATEVAAESHTAAPSTSASPRTRENIGPTPMTPPGPPTNPVTGHLLGEVGKPMTLNPATTSISGGPGAATILVNKITRGKPAYDGSGTVRVAMTVKTGDDQQLNRTASMFICGVMSSVDPDSEEQVSGKGGFMVSGSPPTVLGKNKTYSCTFDAEGLHDYGWLVLGNGGSDYIDYPYDLR